MKPDFLTHRQSIAEANYPDPCKEVLQRLVDVMETRTYSQRIVAQKIKRGSHKQAVSAAVVNQLINGKYPSDPTGLCQSISAFINLETGRAIFRDGGFVKTRLYGTLEDLANVANTTQRVTVLHGANMAGKSVCAEALSRDYDKASVVLMRAPGGDSYGGFLRRLAFTLGLTPRGTLTQLREAILEAMDDNHLLFIDDFHEPLVTYSDRQAVRVFSFLREINDLCHCGIVLIGASEGLTILQTREAYDKFQDRIFFDRDARDFLPAIDDPGEFDGLKDLNHICESFGLTAPSKANARICRNVIETTTVSRLFDLLKIARARTESEGAKLTWGQVIETQETVLGTRGEVIENEGETLGLN